MSCQFIVIRKVSFSSGAFMNSRLEVHECDTEDEVEAILEGRHYSDFTDDEFIVTRPVTRDTRLLTVDDYYEGTKKLKARRPWHPGFEGLPTCGYCGSCEWDDDSTGLGELQEHIREKHEPTRLPVGSQEKE